MRLMMLHILKPKKAAGRVESVSSYCASTRAHCQPPTFPTQPLTITPPHPPTQFTTTTPPPPPTPTPTPMKIYVTFTYPLIVAGTIHPETNVDALRDE